MRSLLDNDFYFEKFIELTAEFPNMDHKSLWIKLENKVYEKYQKYKFSSYDSFRSSKRRYHISLRKNID